MYTNHNSFKRIEVTGVSLSPGIAIGKAFKFKQIDLDSLRNSTFIIKDVKAELNRLHKSILKSKDQLTSLQRSASENGKKDVADIFGAHIQLLQDEVFLESIRDTVNREKQNVEYILSVKINDIELSFRNIDNETVRTRLYDIQDVYQRLLRNLLEIEHVRVTPLVHSKNHPILIAEHLLPSDIALLEFRKITGIIIEESSAVSHVAIITRSFGIPAVTNVPGITSLVHHDTTIIVDGLNGRIIINPTPREIEEYKKIRSFLLKKEEPQKAQRRCLTRDGIRIRLEANANTPEEIRTAVEYGAEGIGLLRSEFFYLGSRSLPQPQDELEFYQKIHQSAGERPITIRLLDLGADKTLPYVKTEPETNPQLGIRGIRYLFAHQELMMNHLKSVLRSSRFGPIRLLIPFVSIVQEIDYLLELINNIIARENLVRSQIEIGIMVEIPSVIWSLSQFISKVDFLSIGTNDLIQYTYASDREDGRLEEYRQASIPVLLKMIRYITKIARLFGKDVAVCGEAASIPAIAPLLIGAGIRELSVRVNALDIIRREIESKSIDQIESATQELLDTISDDVHTFPKE